MVIPFGAIGSFLSSGSGQGMLGAGLLGGGLGALFGGRKKTGFGKALNRGLYAVDVAQKQALNLFEQRGGRFMDALRSTSPSFAALESRVLGDLDDQGRTSRLEEAFMSRLGQQQAASGTFRSPSGALSRSFAGLQFMENQRNMAFDRAMGFQQGVAQPAALGFFNTGLLKLTGREGFNHLAFQTGQRAAQNQSILGGLQEGFNAAVGFAGRRENNTFRNRLLDVLGG